MLSSEYIQLKICRTFCQTPRNGFDFDDEIWFENGSQPLLITDKVKHSGKDHEKNFKSVVAVSNLHKLEYIFVIRKWSYLVIPMSSLVSYNKRPSQEHLMIPTQTLFLNLEASLYEHSKSVTLELSCQPEKSRRVCST